MNNLEAPFYKGQLVTTDFFPKESSKLRTVIRCYPSLASESGWLVDTTNKSEKELLALDSHWYKTEGVPHEADHSEE